MKSGWIFGVALLVAVPAGAWPILSEGRQTPAGWCYPDQEEEDLWWLLPEAAQVITDAGRPDIHLTIYNYTGTREMGDLGDLRSGAVLQFGLAFPTAGARMATAMRSLGPRARIEPLIPETVEAEVVFAGINSTRQATSEGESADESGPWTKRRFSIRLTPEETVAVTEAWQDSTVIISVNLVASARICPTRPPEGLEASIELAPILVDSIPITLDRSMYSEAVRVIALDATMPAGYTSIELGCTELTTSRGFTDVARVIVIVEAEAMNGDVINLRVRFTPDSQPTQTARFNRAIRLSSGYVLRVARVYATGRTEQEPPRRIEVWQGFENVCATEGSRTAALDPRMLY